jgi:S1-C subfamily serine protease
MIARAFCLPAMVLAVLAAAPAQAQQAGKADAVLAAIVGVRAEVPPDARTADVLGTTREGTGALIGEDGLVLTIGYLIVEAGRVDIRRPDGRTVPAVAVAYDYETGFGLVRALAPLDAAPLALGESGALKDGTQLVAISGAAGSAVYPATVVSRREFAGYWEYLLPDAIFAAPAMPEFGGAALIGPEGELLGIGSLIVADAAGDGSSTPGNMYVPIDALKPILAELVAEGRTRAEPRPWLGINARESEAGIVVTRVTEDGPAAAAGLREGDRITAVAGEAVATLAELYRKVWAQGPAGAVVPLAVERAGGQAELSVRSADRYDFLRLDQSL